MRPNLICLGMTAALLACSRPAPETASAPMAHEDGAMERVRHNFHFVMSTESLAARLERPGTIVIHVGRTDAPYLQAHIPGARYLALSAVAREMNGIPNEFPPIPEMARAFEALQIGDESRIVIYSDEPLLAARAWAALDLMGQSARTSVLDGGLVKWRAENRRTDSGPVVTTMMFIRFTPRPELQRLATLAWMRAHLRDSTVVMVDARPPAQFSGTEEPGCPDGQACPQIPEPRRGHIPGARNLFWMNALVSADNPVLKPMHQLHHDLWEPTGADRPGVQTVAVYCRSGLMSSHAYFVARYVGYPDVKLYDGSFIEWSRQPAATFPVER